MVKTGNLEKDVGWSIYRFDDYAYRFHAAEGPGEEWFLVGGDFNKTPNGVVSFRTPESVEAGIKILQRMQKTMLKHNDVWAIGECIEEAASILMKDTPDSEFYSVRMRAFNAVIRSIRAEMDEERYSVDRQLIGLKYFATMSEAELKKMRNVGVKTLKILLKAQQIAHLYLQKRRKENYA